MATVMSKHIYWRRSVFCLLVVLLVAPSAWAQSRGGVPRYLSPFMGWHYGGDAVCQKASECDDKTSDLGLALGSGAGVAFEEEFLYARRFFGDDPALSSSVVTAMSNVVVGPRIGFIRPYGLLGAGFIKARVKLTLQDLADSQTGLAWNIGGGVEIGSARLGLRADIRRVHSMKEFDLPLVPLEGVKLDFSRASFGLVFRY
jgi:hypothetical protein